MDQWNAIKLVVAKGFHQTQGLDYFETFSLVVKPTAIRMVLSLALTYSWSLKQLDVHNAFLNGDLVEDVFMEQPVGFVSSITPTHVYKLHKALYGLKQCPRAWYNKLNSCLLQWGFNSSKYDASIYYTTTHQLQSSWSTLMTSLSRAMINHHLWTLLFVGSIKILP